jgi:hypothetical protein
VPLEARNEIQNLGPCYPACRDGGQCSPC